ncbi:beta-ketoacyl-ACP synthase [Pseudohalioglobus sediminis]|uniref:Beta-ketoacyl-ACP synthase n=1 Tax=Pseudohalioglobus sediminis TaxID=2606449 RepID=A0A5B0WUC5_9GAMM|nr:beta-ketoacyl-ACP synthase [Pseudohalioglobus sediminis]KAA1190496.1 beta-ketoacyl-ACP synthase [Pseudohalioglobus sediminis]
MNRVVVTGTGCVSSLGTNWVEVYPRLQKAANKIQYIEDWDRYEGLFTRLGGPVAWERPAEWSRRVVRSMGRIAMMAVSASADAIEEAGLTGDQILGSGDMGISYGSSAGSTAALGEFGNMLLNERTDGLNATSYIRMMSHTAPVNIGVYFGIKGRIYTTSSACTSSSQGIGYGYEAIRNGLQTVMLCGGAEELCATEAAVFDTLYATSTRNKEPSLTPRPFDRDRDGLVIGEGACSLVLENLDHALARGATIYGEIIGFGTNSDGLHVTQPDHESICRVLNLALEDAGIAAEEVQYVSAHGTATDKGDIIESRATHDVLGKNVPISALKSYTGHTLGACGSLEAWVTLNMMREGWFHPTVNLDNVDERCAELDYITGPGRRMSCDIAMSNNFAFGGINTSLIFRKY